MHPKKRDPSRLQAAPRCGARNRSGNPCQSPAVNGKKRCRMHGGAKGSGAPSGKQNGAWRHGERTKEAMALMSKIAGLVREMRALAGKV
ncbi:MAG: hypothetical protein APF80_06940 [Alphaproteobacteria bacterium BRH_c36]|nr:MAG: hypothetical protein APF80_06940 [Alphaproteobacteria bacterium BRH_c36]